MVARIRLVMATVLVAATAAAAPAAVITQNDPADSLANADWTTGTWDANGIALVGLRADYLSASMIGSPIILQFQVDGNVGGFSDAAMWLTGYPPGPDPAFTITNSTGVTWTDFHIILVNLDPYPFLPHADANFVNLAGVTSDAFGSPTSVTYAANSIALNFDGGTVPSGGTVTFSDIMISDNGVAGGIFYLKLIPTPEPGTLALVCAGVVGLLRIRRKRR